MFWRRIKHYNHKESCFEKERSCTRQVRTWCRSPQQQKQQQQVSSSSSKCRSSSRSTPATASAAAAAGQPQQKQVQQQRQQLQQQQAATAAAAGSEAAEAMLASCLCGLRQSLRDFFTILLLGVRCDVREIIQTDGLSRSGKGRGSLSTRLSARGTPRGAPRVPPFLPVIHRGGPPSRRTMKQGPAGRGTEEVPPSFLGGGPSRGAPRHMLEGTSRDSSPAEWGQRAARQRPRKRLADTQSAVYLL
ncbi:hypothetical protein Esti_000880 [Eimeria stiedai]